MKDGRRALERASNRAHNWRYSGLDPHKGEYWYKCARCGSSDWIASYGTMDQLAPRECAAIAKAEAA
jgi:hypothetical protein